MPVDATVLLYAVDATASVHQCAAAWLTGQLNGGRRIGSRGNPSPPSCIATHPRASARPLTADEAWSFVDDWLAASSVWIPSATDAHAATVGDLVRRYGLTGNLVPDAHLAAIAMERGLEICSTDTDFARFREVGWRNPLA